MLCYSPSNFYRTQRGEDGYKIDRYGKKYSWIAYFELYGLRHDRGLLPEDRIEHRCSDCDIDPSFPPSPIQWRPELPELFLEPYLDPKVWLINGPDPHYQHLLIRQEIDGIKGPWVLINGYVGQASDGDPRQVFTFLHGLFLLTFDSW